MMRTVCDYMIIQRSADGFGRATFAGEFNGGDYTVVARVMREDDNFTVVPWQVCTITESGWEVELTVPEGGLYRFEARVCSGVASPCNNNYDWCPLIACVQHVGVGDVFVMAGQSNMSGYGRDPAYDPPELGVHLFDNRGQWVLAAHPLNSVPNAIYRNTDDSSGTSPGLAFGRMMHRRLGVPVGLVAAARGGSSLEQWNPAEENPDLYRELEKKLEEVGNFAGMIWYQGCNETCEEEEADSYLEKFTETVSLWREKFGYFPIATCQINRHASKEGDRDRLWGKVREAQRRAAKCIEGVYVVPTIDMHTVDGIHNASGACITVGERLANVLLKGHYGLSGTFAPSITKITRVDSRTVHLEFDGQYMLRTMDNIATGINIEDENGLQKCTKISVCDDGALVTAERDIGKNAVFHAYWEREVPAFFIRDINGMPMLACYGVKIE